MSRAIALTVTPGQLAYLIECVEYCREQAGEIYAWPGDPAIRATRAYATRLLAKLNAAEKAPNGDPR